MSTEPRSANTRPRMGMPLPNKAKFPDLGESTVRSFKTKYLAAIARGETVSKIPSKKPDRPFTLGEKDGEVQNYIKSL